MDVIYSTVRIGVASLVGWLVVQSEVLGYALEPELVTAFESSLQLAVSIFFYGLVRLASTKWPQLEWFLGVPKSPVLVSAGNRQLANTVLKRNHVD